MWPGFFPRIPPFYHVHPLVFSLHLLAQLSRQYLPGLNRLSTHKQMRIILAESMFHGCSLYFRLPFILVFGPSLLSFSTLMSVFAFFSCFTKKPLLISQQNTYIFFSVVVPHDLAFVLNYRTLNPSYARHETKQRSIKFMIFPFQFCPSVFIYLFTFSRANKYNCWHCCVHTALQLQLEMFIRSYKHKQKRVVEDCLGAEPITPATSWIQSSDGSAHYWSELTHECGRKR